MSEYIHKSHNVTVLIYHLVFPAKFRRAVFDEDVESVLKSVCLDIEKRYQVKFLEIGTDKDHVHFLVQSVLTFRMTVGKMVFFRCVKEVKSWTKNVPVDTRQEHCKADSVGCEIVLCRAKLPMNDALETKRTLTRQETFAVTTKHRIIRTRR